MTDEQGSAITESLISKRREQFRIGSRASSFTICKQQLCADFIRLLHQHDARQGVWVFAYGALLWRNLKLSVESHVAKVYGLHRRFCLWQHAYRGTIENPCLMLALDHGGSCEGVVYRVQSDQIDRCLWPVFQAEMDGGGYRARWVKATTTIGSITALSFVIDRRSGRYAGHLFERDVVERLALGCGEDGACSDYLRKTVIAARKAKLRDVYLFRLDKLVAEKLNSLQA